MKTSLLAATSLSFALATPAFAQNDTSADAGDIVVTARRTEERLQDVPISITVLSQQQIANRNITTASDLGTYTPSLTSNSRFGPDKSSFTIRGFVQDSNTSPTVGVYFADVVGLRAAAGTASGNNAGPGNYFDLQNVQVLKGPQGTLFGRNTTGGAILLVPQKPTDKLEGYVEGSIGNYDLRRVQAVLNVPLADTFRVRLGVDRYKRDGYLHNQSGVGPKDFGDVDYAAYRLSVVAELTPTLENYAIARYTKSDTNGPLFRLATCDRNPTGFLQKLTAPLACAQIDRQNARGDGFYDVENIVKNPYNVTQEWQVINTTTWTASDAITVKNIASYGELRERFNYSIGGENFRTASGVPFANITIFNAPGDYTAAQSTFTEELQFQGRAFDGRLKWQAGAYYEESKPIGTGNTAYSLSLLACTDALAFKCENALPGSGVSGGLSQVVNRTAFRNIGFYSQGSYDLTDKLVLTAGVRYTIDRATSQGSRVNNLFATPNVRTSRCANPRLPLNAPGSATSSAAACTSALFVQKSERPTWLIDLEYKPISDMMVYAKWSRGYRQGGVNNSSIGLETWGPEKVDTYEVGAKTSFNGFVRGYLNLAGFYNDFRDQQLATQSIAKLGSGLQGANILVNAGKSRIYGVEVDGAIMPFKGLKIDLGYAYLNTKLQAFIPPVLAADSPYSGIRVPLVGDELPLSPNHRVTATATYTLPLDESIGDISVGATYTYTSSQISAPANSQGRLPSSELVNLNLNWNSVAGLPVDAAVFVTNVTKEKFPLAVANNFPTYGYEAVVPNLPRMYGLRLKYRFGN